MNSLSRSDFSACAEKDDSQNSEIDLVAESDSQTSEGLPELSDSSFDGSEDSDEEQSEEEDDYDEKKNIPWKMVQDQIKEFMQVLEKQFKPMAKKSKIQQEMFYVVVDCYQQN
jgi:hypothetical protein